MSNKNVHLEWSQGLKNLHGVVDNVLDCDIVEHEFELQSHNYIQFQTNALGKYMKSRILSALCWVVSLLFFNKIGFGIK